MVVAPSLKRVRDGRDRTERLEADDLEGAETDLSRLGTASSAKDGEVLGDGEPGLSSDELSLLSELMVVSRSNLNSPAI